MANGSSGNSERSPIEIAHFALGAVGFFIGAAGVVLSSVCIAVIGAFFAAWALAYFAANDA
jgi:hypothetical protein